MECKRLDIPYPEIKIERQNTKYAQLLMEDYAGVISEMTAINLYTYQNILNKKNYSELSEMLHDISITEMRHLQILGELINLLGLYPTFQSVNNGLLCSWDSSYINYNTDIKEMLLIDIKSEEEAIAQYRLHQSIIDDKYIKEIIERIILDEQQHIKCFKMVYKIVEDNF